MTIYRDQVQMILNDLSEPRRVEILKEYHGDLTMYYACMTGAMTAILKMIMSPDAKIAD